MTRPTDRCGSIHSGLRYLPLSLSLSHTHTHTHTPHSLIHSLRHGHTRITGYTIKVTNLWAARAVVDPFRAAASYRSRTIAVDETPPAAVETSSFVIWSCRILSRLDPPPAHKLNALFISTHTATAVCLSTDPPVSHGAAATTPSPSDTHIQTRARVAQFFGNYHIGLAGIHGSTQRHDGIHSVYGSDSVPVCPRNS